MSVLLILQSAVVVEVILRHVDGDVSSWCGSDPTGPHQSENLEGTSKVEEHMVPK